MQIVRAAGGQRERHVVRGGRGQVDRVLRTAQGTAGADSPATVAAADVRTATASAERVHDGPATDPAAVLPAAAARPVHAGPDAQEPGVRQPADRVLRPR